MAIRSGDSDRIQLVTEHVDVNKSDVVTDRVRISTTVDEREVTVDYVQEHGHLHVERVPVDRPVENAPDPRQEGDTLIVSLVEERLVVEKRLFVTEEIRITRMSTSEIVSAPLTLRTTRATVDRGRHDIGPGRE